MSDLINPRIFYSYFTIDRNVHRKLRPALGDRRGQGAQYE